MMTGEIQCRSLDELATEKERELQELKQRKAHVVHETLRGIHNELCTERQKVAQLQTDFDYNLSLLSERNLELSRYESVFTELKRVVNSLLAENSELKVCVDGLHCEVEQSRQSLQQMKAHYVKRIEELHLQMDAYRNATQSEVEGERGRLERLQRELERRLLEIEGDMFHQKEQLTAQFEEMLKRREHEFQLKCTQLNASVLSKEKQLRNVNRELEQAESAKLSSQQHVQGREEELERLRKTVREQEWTLEDERNSFQSKLMDTQTELTHALSVTKTQQEEFERRRAELDRLVREKDSVLKAAKEAHCSREASLEQQLMELKSEWERESRRLQWERVDVIKEKDTEIQRLKERLASIQTACDSTTSELTQEVVSKDVKIESLQTSIDRRREELCQQEKDIEQYRREILVAQEKERSLEQSKAQLQLDWEQRLAECEGQAYSKHQLIIQQLTASRDKLGSEVKDARLSIEKLATDLQDVQQERDIAIATLNKHGLASDCHVTDHMTELQQQNKELQNVIKQMRQDMEQVTNKDVSMPTTGYTEYIESEMVRLKAENRQLSERLMKSLGKPPSPGVPQVTKKQHQSHLIALSDTIANLQREKAALELTVTQLRSRMEELERELTAEKEQAYILKACQVPETKLHHKLLQATKVIISLVKEKEALVYRLKEASKKDSENSPAHSSSTHSRSHVDKSVQVSQQSSSLQQSDGQQQAHQQHSPAATLIEEHQPHENTLDMSLASLKFTESSLGGDSLQQVLQLAERDHELMDHHDDRGIPFIRHSTPELELVGNKAPVQSRPGKTAGSHSNSARNFKARPVSSKTRKVRNYNSKD